MAQELSVEWPESIIVGVDGSDSSKLALAWAARQAELTAASLEVIWVWEAPASYGWPVAWPEADFERDISHALDELVEEVLGSDPPVKVTKTVAEGHPGFVLSERSRAAGLLVVGRRGLGALKELLLGSVSSHLASHSHCSLVIVRPPAGSDRPSSH